MTLRLTYLTHFRSAVLSFDATVQIQYPLTISSLSHCKRFWLSLTCSTTCIWSRKFWTMSELNQNGLNLRTITQVQLLNTVLSYLYSIWVFLFSSIELYTCRFGYVSLQIIFIQNITLLLDRSFKIVACTMCNILFKTE